MLKIVTLILLLFFEFCFISYSQSVGSGAQILSRNTSPVIAGLGGAGVAFPASDATSFSYNPANLGTLMRKDNFMFTFNTNAINLGNTSEIPFTNLAVNVGFDLEKITKLPLRIGLGFMNQNVDLGEFTRVDDNGNILGKFEASESSNSFALSATYEYYALFSLGLTYKSYRADFQPINSASNSAEGIGNAFDYGASVSIPILHKTKILDDIFADIGVNIGWAMLNVGPEIDYENYEVPFPRTSSTGYNLSFGLNYIKNAFELELFKINWSAATMESLVYFDSLGFAYDYPFNEISIIDNLLLMRAKSYVNTGFGWNITILQTVSILKGWSYSKNRMLPADGVLFSSSGIIHLLNAKYNSDLLNFFAKHLNINYCLTKLTMPISDGNNQWVYDTFQGINVVLRL